MSRAGGPLLLLTALVGCAAPQASSPPRAAAVVTPADLYGPLFEAVQMRRIFPDGKTFVDSVPRRPVAAVTADYRRAPPADDAALRAFVLAHFVVPETLTTPPLSAGRPPLAEHIRALWPVMARPPLTPPPGSSALALPHAYVVPGGRFREMYYWDSYFTMLGLEADGRSHLTRAIVANFVSLVERYGHVLNGTRTYYLSRSQPPFLHLMMGLSPPRDAPERARRLAALRREWSFFTAPARVARMPDGSVLHRYRDARDTPRDESHREDVETARLSGRPAREVYRHLRAGAESGWDFSSRWFADGRALSTIDTANIVPVDLNGLLWSLERFIAAECGVMRDAGCARDFATRADARGRAVERWLWDEAGGRYGDWDVGRGAIRPGVTAATAYPLFVGRTVGPRAARVAATIKRDLLAPGGLRTSTVVTGQQWDKPNGWAPLQWIAADGLRRTGHDRLAREIAVRFVATVEREYRASGKLLEKYDLEERRPGGGGEYPTQDGFGWTNGVVRAFQERYGL